jgi:kinesin family protein 18/19
VSSETVFDKSVKFALDGVLDGFNATVFAYGATGAGKTYTMLGTEETYGVMGLTF